MIRLDRELIASVLYAKCPHSGAGCYNCITFEGYKPALHMCENFPLKLAIDCDCSDFSLEL